MENSDLIHGEPLTGRGAAGLVKSKGVENGHSTDETNGGSLAVECRRPPDGGVRAWMVLVSSFLCNGILFGVINTFGVIHFHLHKKLEMEGDKEASSKAALVGSLSIGTMFLLSPVAGVLTDRLGIRLTTFLGGALAAGGMLLSSFLCHSVPALFFTYGFMYGLGAALAYTPSLAILGHYFSRYLGLVNGIVTSGSSVFTVIMPLILEHFIATAGLEAALRVLALMSSFVMVCAMLFKPLPPIVEEKKTNPEKQTFAAVMKSVIHLDNWKQKRYIIWVIAIPSALFGYFIPYVHMASFVDVEFGTKSNVPIMCIGVTSGIGRLLFGYIADHPKVNRIYLQQIAFYSIGVLSMCLPFAPSYGVLLTIALGMGLFDGCFISLLGPIAFDLCGQKGGTQGIGFLLGLCSVPLTLGPPVAGLIYDHTQSYKLPFLLSGIPPLIGASIMFFITCMKDPVTTEIKPATNGHSLTSNAWKNDLNPASPKSNGFHHEESESLTAVVTPGRLRCYYNSRTPYNLLTPSLTVTQTPLLPQPDSFLHQPLLSASLNLGLLPSSSAPHYTNLSCPTKNSEFISDNLPIWPLSVNNNYRCNQQWNLAEARKGRQNSQYQSIPLVD